MEELSSNVWWWSDPNEQWIQKVLDHMKTFLPQDNGIILLHCEDVTGFEKSIPLTNYFLNMFLVLKSLEDEHTMFLNLKDMITSIELQLGRQKKKTEVSEDSVPDEDIIDFYNKYINSFEQENEDKSITAFKDFLKQNNCLDVRLLLDSCLKYEKSDICQHINGYKYLILGVPSSLYLKQFIRILSGEEKVCSVSVEIPLDVSLHGSPNIQVSERIKVDHEYVEIKDMPVNSEPPSKIGSATEEYVEDIFLSFLSLLVNSRNELALSRALISPVIDLSHEAFTALKHMSDEKEMPMCQVAISFVTRIRLGGKGYAPPSDCPLLGHLKGLELFVDTLNQMQTVIEEDSCPRSAIRRLINILKKKLLKCGSEKLKDSCIEAVSENLQSTHVTVSEILKERVSSNKSQICQGTLDILYHFINFLNCGYFIYNPETVLAKRRAKRTPLNLPPLLGYFRSPDEESSCDTKLSLNEDSCLSRSSVVQNTAFPSYFHHSESSEVSMTCVNSSTPSKLTFKGCVKESDENSQNQKKIMMVSENAVKKNRKRSILSEITNENVSTKDNYDPSAKTGVKKVYLNCKENAVVPSNKKLSKKEPKKGAKKKFKQIEGQGKITSFFISGKR